MHTDKAPENCARQVQVFTRCLYSQVHDELTMPFTCAGVL